MPRSAFWAPVTAERYASLFDRGGDDDYFSSDFTDGEMRERLCHVGDVGRETGMRLLAAFSGRDEYVPDFVDGDDLMKRLVAAMNGGANSAGGREVREDATVARGIMLKNGNHNLSEGDGAKEEFVEAVGKLLQDSS